MSLSAKYQVAGGLRVLSEYLGFDPGPSLLRAGLPLDFLGAPERLVTGPQYYALWNSVAETLPDPDLPKVLSDFVLHSALDTSSFAFFSSPTVRVGMQRKALFKPLVLPIRFALEDSGDAVAMVVSSPLAAHPLPHLIGWVNLVFLLSIARKASGHRIVPVRVEVAADWARWTDRFEFFGVVPQVTGRNALVLSPYDMDRPLVTRDDTGWAEVTRAVDAQFAGQLLPGSTAEQVRQALIEGLPGGQAGADQVSRKLGVSRRSLQRRLGDEGIQFREILEDTRRALALRYLQRRDLAMQEIALLLGFRDPTSFFRAFKSWTGQTPHSLRGMR